MGNSISRINHGPTAVNRNTTGIGLALLVALGLHGLLLFLPLSGQKTEINPQKAQIEVQLIGIEPPVVAEKKLVTEVAPPPVPDTVPEPMVQDTFTPLENAPLQAQAPTPSVTPLVRVNRDLEQMNTAERTRLTSIILSSQFITEESAADQLFGEPVKRYDIKTQKAFHYPERDQLGNILNQPMQKLPFEYMPGLIRFAYAPGVKGDLQRFWDTITPEFGWITDNGTEVRCKWLLVIAGCGWK